MKKIYKVCIVLMLLVVSYGMGCVDNSSASNTGSGNLIIEDSLEVGGGNGNGISYLYVIHDDANDVTLYVTVGYKSGGITAIPDSMLDKNN